MNSMMRTPSSQSPRPYHLLVIRYLMLTMALYVAASAERNSGSISPQGWCSVICILKLRSLDSLDKPGATRATTAETPLNDDEDYIYEDDDDFESFTSLQKTKGTTGERYGSSSDKQQRAL